MSGTSNIKLLSKEERDFFKQNYKFTLKDDVIIVQCNDYGRLVAHSIDEDFSIVTKLRKVKITSNAMYVWKDNFQNTEYSLIDIQNAINALLLGYQATNVEDIQNQLNVIKAKDETIL